jgi:hypothetical protein
MLVCFLMVPATLPGQGRSFTYGERLGKLPAAILDLGRHPAGLFVAQASIILKPVGKGVIRKMSNYPKKGLSNQEYQMERKRLARQYIFQILDEIEAGAGYRPSYGFPFDLLAGGINKTLDGFESLVDKAVLKALTKLKDHNKS